MSTPAVEKISRLPEQYLAAESLERYLGDPSDASNTFSFDKSVALDELELYPEDSCALLDAWGLNLFYVPKEFGGRLCSYEQLLSLLKVVARRNLTAAVAHAKTFFGASAVWVGGSEQQHQRLASIISGGGQASLAYNEREHGSDLLSGDVHAERVTGGYALSGEKWLVNNATRGAALTVFARTAVEGGPRGFSLFLVEKSALDASTFAHLPALKTLGVRGADLSGVRFEESVVREDALIGAEGSALELTLKASQLTRSLVAGLSLGAADTALRCVMDFALSRRLYGGTLIAIPHARRLIATAFIDALVCDCMATAIARSMHEATGQMRLYASASKFFVPRTVESLISDLSVVLGARYYLREGHYSGAFQKLVRDNKVLGIFHSGTFLNLTTVGLHLEDLAKQRARGSSDPALPSRLHRIFTLHGPLASFDCDALRLFSRGRDDILYGLPLALDSLSSRLATHPQDESLPLVLRLVEELVAGVAKADQEQAESRRRLGAAYGESVEAFEQAERYCELLAAGCCVQMWEHNRGSGLGAYFDSGEWVALGLSRLLARMGSKSEGQRAAWERYEAGAVKEMERRLREGLSFSIVPLRLPHDSRT